MTTSTPCASRHSAGRKTRLKVTTKSRSRSARNNDPWSRSQKVKPGTAIEAQLVEQHLPLVKTVVGRLAMTLPAHVDGEDLYSAGLTGLLNAVRQAEGRDYRVEGEQLVFDRELVQEGRLGFWRWFWGAWGIGTYRRDDQVDVAWEVDGRPQVAHKLAVVRDADKNV